MPIKFIVVLLLISGLFFSCKKETKISSVNAQKKVALNVFNVSDNAEDDFQKSSGTKTILGSRRTNPYTTANMAMAHRSLYKSSMREMPTTHYYVEFTPKDIDDMNTLDNSDISTFDFDMEYEVIKMGDYYQDRVEGTYPKLYAVIGVNETFPAVNYVILDDLYLEDKDKLLIIESLRLTNNESYIPDYSPLEQADLTDDNIDLIPTPPDCGPGFYVELTTVVIPNPPFLDFIYDCIPFPDPPVGAECIVGHVRKPGGSILVEDTELGMQPVRDIKVFWWNGWFSIKKTTTDDNGCWKINKKMFGNNYMWTRFKSCKCKIRSVESNWEASYQWISAVKDYVGQMSGGTYNNIQLNYNMWGVQGSPAHRYWASATVNNAVHEFNDFSVQEGIGQTPNDLDIYVGLENGFGYALMSVQNDLGAAAGSALQRLRGLLLPLQT